jgi:4-amino-4-deoxy-L-arabinose transferase-like glycosyltransferase
VTDGSENSSRVAPAARPSRFAAGGLFLPALLAVVLSFAGIWQHQLWTPDEPREAEIGREMFEAHGSAMPTLGGEPFLEKPPLFVWTMAASFQLFGVSAAAARVPAALFSIAALLAACVLAKRGSAGLLAIVVLASTSEFWSVSHRAINDTALTAFVAWTHVCLLSAWERRRAVDWLVAGVLTGLAFMTKGVIGPVLALAPPLAAIFLMGDRKFAIGLGLRAGVASLAAIAAFGGPWAFALAQHEGGWHNVYQCVVAQVLARSLGGTAELSGHTNPFWYYLKQLPLSCAPWILAVPALFLSGVLRRGNEAPRLRALLLTVVAGVVLLSIPSGKRGPYLVPLFPALAAVFGGWLAQAQADRKFERVTARVLIGVVAVASLALALFAALAPFGLFGHAPALAPILASGLAPLRWIVATAGIVTALFAWFAWRVTSARHAQPLARAVAIPLLLLLLTSHMLVRPLADPVKGLEAGAIAVARSVPDSEPLLAFAPDETTLAVVPFYGGRKVVELTGEKLLAEMARRGSRHLLVMDNGFGRVPEEARAHLKPVRTIEFTPTRALQLLELVP